MSGVGCPPSGLKGAHAKQGWVRQRHMLDDFGGDPGVIDPVSGEVVVDLK